MSEIERIGHCFTWIKANPTFKGLKHAITEFEDRVFVGNIPPKIELVRANSRKFIESVTIEKISNSKLTTKWFEEVGTIPFNSGLISIIGNKGSGKSGLTDILGLLGNSKNQQHFSFLEANRFKNKKDKLAENFVAKIKWADGHEIQRKLNDVIDDTKPELVRYIPQKFFESICNDIAKEDNQFERELHQVIFSHIPVVDRHDQISLKDLIKYKTIELKDSLDLIKNDISGINAKIWEIEQKLRPEYKKTIENQKIEKLKELEAYRKTKLVKIKKPENKNDTALSKDVEAKNLQITNLLDKEKEIRKSL